MRKLALPVMLVLLACLLAVAAVHAAGASPPTWTISSTPMAAQDTAVTTTPLWATPSPPATFVVAPITAQMAPGSTAEPAVAGPATTPAIETITGKKAAELEATAGKVITSVAPKGTDVTGTIVATTPTRPTHYSAFDVTSNLSDRRAASSPTTPTAKAGLTAMARSGPQTSLVANTVAKPPERDGGVATDQHTVATILAVDIGATHPTFTFATVGTDALHGAFVAGHLAEPQAVARAGAQVASYYAQGEAAQKSARITVAKLTVIAGAKAA